MSGSDEDFDWWCFYQKQNNFMRPCYIFLPCQDVEGGSKVIIEEDWSRHGFCSWWSSSGSRWSRWFNQNNEDSDMDEYGNILLILPRDTKITKTQRWQWRCLSLSLCTLSHNRPPSWSCWRSPWIATNTQWQSSKQQQKTKIVIKTIIILFIIKPIEQSVMIIIISKRK